MPTEKQRREAERRRLQRQLERRREREAARRRFTLIASVVGALVVIAVVVTVIAVTTGGSTPSAAGKSASPTSSVGASTSAAPSSTAPTSAATSPTAAAYPCTFEKSGSAAKPATPPSTTPPKKGMVTVSVATTRGAMTFTLNRALAPCTVASFVSLVRQHYYDRTPCHRLVTAGIYVLQCGDPSGTGAGGPGYTIPDEATGKETYPAGTIAMARTSSAHSGGSQFFLVYRSSPTLQQNLGRLQYTVFGTVKSGLGVVQTVAKAGVAAGGQSSTDGKPKLSVQLTKLTVTS